MPADDVYDAAFPDLTFDRPAAGVLRITLDGPGLNATGPAMHRQLADVWVTIDRDPDVRVAHRQDHRRPHPPRRRRRRPRGDLLAAAVRDGEVEVLPPDV